MMKIWRINQTLNKLKRNKNQNPKKRMEDLKSMIKLRLKNKKKYNKMIFNKHNYKAK
jgi:hypothetical protein